MGGNSLLKERDAGVNPSLTSDAARDGQENKERQHSGHMETWEVNRKHL